MASKNSNKEILEASPIHGDVLETILSHVPLIDLAQACHVSKRWHTAVSSSLRYISRPKPWLIVHAQSTWFHAAVAMRAYDPRSDAWVEIEPGPSMMIKHDTIVRSSSHSNLVYTISPSGFSFSLDPFHLTWHHAKPPKVWRVDPIVAAVGRHVIVAGGTYDFEEDPLSVEMYDPDSATWTTCDPMPDSFKHSSSSQWVSTSTDGSTLYVTEKRSGASHAFDPTTKAWSPPSDLLHRLLSNDHNNISSFFSAFVNNRRILIGLVTGGGDEAKGVIKMWRRVHEGFEEIGEIPKGILEGEDFSSSLGVCSAGDFLYVYSGSNLVVCEFVDNECRWRSVKNANIMMGEGAVMERMVFSCSEVGIADLHNVLRSKNRRFRPIP